jgi:hypothetical protein
MAVSLEPAYFSGPRGRTGLWRPEDPWRAGARALRQVLTDSVLAAEILEAAQGRLWGFRWGRAVRAAGAS